MEKLNFSCRLGFSVMSLLVALSGVLQSALAHDEVVIDGMKYTTTDGKTCRVSCVDFKGVGGISYNKGREFTILDSVEINGSMCVTTSIGRIVDGSFVEDGLYRYYDHAKYNFPATIDTISTYTFGFQSMSWQRVKMPNLQFPTCKVVEEGAFSNCYLSWPDEEPWVKPRLVIPEGVDSIGHLINEYGLEFESLPSTLRHMAYEAIYIDELSWSKYLTCYAVEPPVVDDHYGDVKPICWCGSPITLYVPEESVEAYKAAPGWCDIPYILPIVTSEIGDVSESKELVVDVADGTIIARDATSPLQVFSFDGRLCATSADGVVSGLPAGLYIVRCGQSVRKVYIK